MAELDLAGLKRLEAAILNVLANTGTGDRAGARKRLQVAYEDADLPAVIAVLERAERLEKLAVELAEFALDAACQGVSEKPLSNPTWHCFISTWEYADELFRREDFRELLSAEQIAWLDNK